MNSSIYDSFVYVLKKELKKAQGCTEPIAVALSAARARKELGCRPDSMHIIVSANMFKNARCVVVPNSGGERGIEAAAVLGAFGGDPDNELEVLTTVTDSVRAEAEMFLQDGRCTCEVLNDVEELYVSSILRAGTHSAEVTIANAHTNIVKIKKDDKIILEFHETDKTDPVMTNAKELLTFDNILDFAESVDVDLVRPILTEQLLCNKAISAEGLSKSYGCRVGQTLFLSEEKDVRTLAKARAAAGSDARMNGCDLPVVINSGSGNQGLTVSLPVFTYAESMGAGEEKLLRALCISNLISIFEKKHLGQLSAYCGAVTAAAGVSAALCYLKNGTRKQMADAITNTLATAGGMVCDGAKSSCASKIACALDSAITAYEMSMSGLTFGAGEGIVQNTVDETIRVNGYIGRVGMKSCDSEILNIMAQN